MDLKVHLVPTLLPVCLHVFGVTFSSPVFFIWWFFSFWWKAPFRVWNTSHAFAPGLPQRHETVFYFVSFLPLFMPNLPSGFVCSSLFLWSIWNGPRLKLGWWAGCRDASGDRRKLLQLLAGVYCPWSRWQGLLPFALLLCLSPAKDTTSSPDSAAIQGFLPFVLEVWSVL